MRWLFLVHQVYTPNSKERVKVWRAIKKTGAVLYRNSVYLLPYSKERLEDFQWVCQQINDAKGEASVFVSNAEREKEDAAIKTLFNKARQEEYEGLIKAVEQLQSQMKHAKNRKILTNGIRKRFLKDAKQLQEDFDEIRKIDFFSYLQPKELKQKLDSISHELESDGEFVKVIPLKRRSIKDFQKKIWTTREDIHIDRLCSAWLIHRFIDPSAKFVFAPEKKLPSNAIPFDVFGAEFSHHGEDCTFETLMRAFHIQDPALSKIAEIIHDIDLKDHKFGRPEASGLDLVMRSLADSIHNDERFLEAGSSILDALYKSFSKHKG